MIKKIIISLTIIASLTYISYINLGNIVDSTSEPKKVDLLVCLGGGDDEVEKLVYEIVDNQKKEFYIAFHKGLR